jgi:hypothetical protein
MSRPGHCTPGKKIHYPLNRRFFGTQIQNGSLGEEINILPLPGFDPRIDHDYDIPSSFL